MTTLITGATGLLGNNVARSLLAEGEAVRVLVRPQTKLESLEGLNVEIHRGELEDLAAVQRACRGVRCVIHSAAWVGIGWSQKSIAERANVLGTRNICRAIGDQETRLLHVSTVDTLPAASEPTKPVDEQGEGMKVPCTYVTTKREAEQVVREEMNSGLDAVILHPGFMLGPWDWKPSSGRMLLEVVRRFTPIAPAGGCSACDVRDVTAGVLSAREAKRGARYILAGHNVSYQELWSQFCDVVGQGSKPWMRAGPLIRVLGGASGDLLYRITGHEPDLNSAAVRMSSLYNYYDSGHAERDLKYRIRPLEESIRSAWDWFVEYGYAPGQ